MAATNLCATRYFWKRSETDSWNEIPVEGAIVTGDQIRFTYRQDGIPAFDYKLIREKDGLYYDRQNPANPWLRVSENNEDELTLEGGWSEGSDTGLLRIEIEKTGS